MQIKQFFDESLAQASYMVISAGKAAIIDPQRDPQIYVDFAQKHQAQIVAILQTHPHADFVSGHLEIHQKTDAPILHSAKLGATYPHQTFEEGDVFTLGSATIHPLFTPGHSPDSLSYLLRDSAKNDLALFSGDTLFIGDVGRPDLREKAGNLHQKREELARQMYHTIQNKIKPLPDDIMIYPAHGNGSLCGKNMSDERYSTLGQQRIENWALSDMSEEEFVQELLDGQPYIPKYFSYAVELNREGAPHLSESLQDIPTLANPDQIPPNALIIDTRPQHSYKHNHLAHSINLQLGENAKFETWLGSIVAPQEPFYLVTGSAQDLETAKYRAARIGYDQLIKGGTVFAATARSNGQFIDLDHFSSHPQDYTILDIRQSPEAESKPIFDSAIHIPLDELRERTNEIPTGKPVVVHCAGGYRSAAGYSILQNALKEVDVYDLSDAVKDFA